MKKSAQNTKTGGERERRGGGEREKERQRKRERESLCVREKEGEGDEQTFGIINYRYCVIYTRYCFGLREK